MAVVGCEPITIAAWRDAIIAELGAEFTVRAQTLGRIGMFDPGALADADGNVILPTPAILLRIGPSETEIPMSTLAGTDHAAERITWEALHVVSSRTGDMELDSYELVSITRAILNKADARGTAGNQWGLGHSVDRPHEIATQPVDLKTPGLFARMLTWQQAARLVDGYL